MYAYKHYCLAIQGKLLIGKGYLIGSLIGTKADTDTFGSEESEESGGKFLANLAKRLELASENEPLPAALRLRRVYRYLGGIRLSK